MKIVFISILQTVIESVVFIEVNKLKKDVYNVFALEKREDI